MKTIASPQDRLVRWEYGGPALLETGEVIAPELPPAQGARAFQAENPPPPGTAVELW
jgi:hypothetical protein|eukprot:COSAG06_NODE_5208_length_3637_cov_91.168739_2_plen_57_part_00